MRHRILYLLLGALPATLLAQTPAVAPIPRDPLELVTGQIQPAVTTAQREPVLQLLSRARNAYALRNLSRPWDLKVRFTVNSLGQTDYDGDWQMEDVFAPNLGLHWTAQASAGFAITGLFTPTQTYADATAAVVPLRLQEARALLYNPIPSVTYADAGSLRTTAAALHGVPVTCVLLAHSRTVSNPAAARGWDETEECIDPQSGLLQLHSEIPGRYAVYDYANPAKLGSHTLPRTVTVTEAGRVVSTISVESLQSTAAPDAELFVPTNAMKAAGPAVDMASTTRISRIQAPTGAAVPALRPVPIYGLVTAAGRLVEAHSLQPNDPNSAAALQDAQAIDFSPSLKPGAPPQQHFIFILEKFATHP